MDATVTSLGPMVIPLTFMCPPSGQSGRLISMPTSLMGDLPVALGPTSTFWRLMSLLFLQVDVVIPVPVTENMAYEIDGGVTLLVDEDRIGRVVADTAMQTGQGAAQALILSQQRSGGASHTECPEKSRSSAPAEAAIAPSGSTGVSGTTAGWGAAVRSVSSTGVAGSSTDCRPEAALTCVFHAGWSFPVGSRAGRSGK